MERPRTRISAMVLETPQPQALATFYETGLSFSLAEDYVRPVWPAALDEQQMMMHLDISVEDLEAGVVWAQDAGAVLADFQPQEHVRVMLDPDGHPFCLFQGGV